jgi:hypothetical protein
MVLVGKPEGKRPRCRWVDNTWIKRHIRELGWGGVDWIGLAWDKDKWRALMKLVMNLHIA